MAIFLQRTSKVQEFMTTTAARGRTFTYEDSVRYPQIRHRWKAEILRFLYVSLVWGVKVTSLLTISAQSYCFVLEFSICGNLQIQR